MPTVQNTVTDPAGAALENVDVIIRLVAALPENHDSVGFLDGADDETVISTVELVTDASGDWSTNLVANELITPAGTYYVVDERATTPTRRSPVRYRIEVPDGAGPYWVGDILTDAPDSIDSSAASAHVVDDDVHHSWARQFLTAG